jgi:hypothetical protein
LDRGGRARDPAEAVRLGGEAVACQTRRPRRGGPSQVQIDLDTNNTTGRRGSGRDKVLRTTRVSRRTPITGTSFAEDGVSRRNRQLFCFLGCVRRCRPDAICPHCSKRRLVDARRAALASNDF